MPYKSEKIKIEKTKFDRRIKLTDEEKATIYANKGGLSQRKLASLYGVSRRLIQFILDPAKAKENYQRRIDRGGSKQYYDKDSNKESVKKTRRYKQELFLKGKIKLTKS